MKKQIKDLELWEVDFLVAKAEGIKTYKSNQAINKVLLNFRFFHISLSFLTT